MKLYCKCGCGKEIPNAKIKKNGMKNAPQFYDREHFTAWRKARGFYIRFSGLGLDVQRRIKKQTGHAPGHEKRKAALDRVRHLSRRNKPQK